MSIIDDAKNALVDEEYEFKKGKGPGNWGHGGLHGVHGGSGEPPGGGSGPEGGAESKPSQSKKPERTRTVMEAPASMRSNTTRDSFFKAAVSRTPKEMQNDPLAFAMFEAALGQQKGSQQQFQQWWSRAQQVAQNSGISQDEMFEGWNDIIKAAQSEAFPEGIPKPPQRQGIFQRMFG